MADGRANVKINPVLHEKMKELVKRNGNIRTITQEYELAIKNHIAHSLQEGIIKDSKLEEIIENKLSKTDKHLSSMLGRTGMDVSMILMGLIILLEKEFDADKKSIMEKLRQDGARYFTETSKSK